jgi:alpha-tubulin suppressor-like RCC1 family protein
MATLESADRVCVCAADGDEEVCGDGRDNDCDGQIDNCISCGARLVPPDDRLNCGACGYVCPAGTLCDNHLCVCPANDPTCSSILHTACTTSDDCDDHVDCTEDACVAGRCIAKLLPERCGAGTSCDPRATLCVAGPTCARNADCADEDPCTVDERCDPEARRCIFQTLDGDGDGFAPAICGGEDCNDTDPFVAPAASERCDGKDNDCDGVRDESVQADSCGADQTCREGACVCAPGRVSCNGVCTDTSRDEAHCGSCGNTCAEGTLCLDGLCECPASASVCQGICRTPASLAEDPENCGACGTTCKAGLERCEAGACVCDGGGAVCGDACVSLASDTQHCGACGAVCNGQCIAGICSVPQALVGGFASTCILYEDGRAACYGRVGLPVRSFLRDMDDSPLRGIVQLSMNDVASGPLLCARLDSGAVYCGGDVMMQDLGDATQLTPIALAGAVPLRDAVDVKVGSDGACALRGTGELVCWGPGRVGGLGARRDGGSALSVAVVDQAGVPLRDVVQFSIAPLVGQACAVRADGSVLCWGSNERGEASPSASGVLAVATPVRAGSSALTGVAEVAVAAGASCARTLGGQVQCWGGNERGQLGRATVGETGQTAAPVVDAQGVALGNVTRLEGATSSVCARVGADALWCWGSNDRGQLGDGSTEARFYAGLTLAHAGEVSLSYSHGCAITPERGLVCWGDEALAGSAARAGLSLFAQPVRWDDGSAVSDVRLVGVGAQHTCFVAGSRLACWGNDSLQQLAGTAPGSARWPLRNF